MKDPGIYYGIPHAEYLADEALSSSALKHMSPTAAHHKRYLLTKDEEQPTAAMIIGTCIHGRLLTPDAPLPKVLAMGEEVNLRTKAGREWKAAKEREGFFCLRHDEYDTIARCVDGALDETQPAGRLCRVIFSAGKSEVSVWSPLDYCGVIIPRKIRVDFVPDGNALVDVKTCQNASPEQFIRTVLDHDYHCQAAYYLDVWNDANPTDRKSAFVWIAIEKPTGFCAVYQADAELIARGRKVNYERLSHWAECTVTGFWPAYPAEDFPMLVGQPGVCPPILRVPKWKQYDDSRS